MIEVERSVEEGWNVTSTDPNAGESSHPVSSGPRPGITISSSARVTTRTLSTSFINMYTSNNKMNLRK